MARGLGWRATTAFDLWFCVRDRPGRAVLAEAAPSGRLAACRQGFPRCTRDTSTQTLKILGSWMYALAYVNCDLFSFPFLVGARVAGRSTRPGGALASISSDVSVIRLRASYRSVSAHGTWCCATPRYVQNSYYETGEDIDRSTLTSPITYHFHSILLTYAREANVRCTDSSFKQLSI